MNAVGIDVSKGKSMVAIMRPLGEVVTLPFEVTHTVDGLKGLVSHIQALNGDTRVVMEYTGTYYQPVAQALHEAGIFVSVVHAKLIADFGNNTIRKVKTDKKDALKIAQYGLTHWGKLTRYTPEAQTRQLLLAHSREYHQYQRTRTQMKNHLVALLNRTFPGLNTLFTSPIRADGSQKWLNFARSFWHCECVCGISRRAFELRYQKWCANRGYKYSQFKAQSVYNHAYQLIGVLPRCNSTKLLIQQAIAQIDSLGASQMAVLAEMQRLSAMLPETPVVLAMRGVGNTLAPQLIAEIGNVLRFDRKQSLVAFAGLDSPPYQSGQFESQNRRISKKGSPHLRRALFQVMSVLIKNSTQDDAVYRFLDRKRAEGKKFRVYMAAASAKFLRIYYARVKEFLLSQAQTA